MTTFHVEALAGRRDAEPVGRVGRRDVRLLAHALRADHDVGQVEADVGKRGQKLRVEARCAFVAFPAVTGLHELVDAVRRKRRDEPGQVTCVLGDRVRLVQLAHFRVETRASARAGKPRGLSDPPRARAYYRRVELDLVFLGTSASMPSALRAPPALLVRRGGERLLFDCAEGTQRQLQRSTVGLPDLEEIFLTHFHADHFLGLPGMLKTFALRGREGVPLTVYGPAGFKELFARLKPFLGRLPYPLTTRRARGGRRARARRVPDRDLRARPRRLGTRLRARRARAAGTLRRRRGGCARRAAGPGAGDPAGRRPGDARRRNA